MVEVFCFIAFAGASVESELDHIMRVFNNSELEVPERRPGWIDVPEDSEYPLSSRNSPFVDRLYEQGI